MKQALLANELTIRLGFFVGVFSLMTLWEMLRPRRVKEGASLLRWSSNLGIMVFNTLIVRWLFPMAAVGLALVEEQQHWGLLSKVPIPDWATFVVSVILLDLALYLQHVLFHAVPALWRLHRMHHADIFFDVTTGIRFHPLEILLSMGIKLAVVAALGPPALAVLVFEVLLNATSMFNHGNVWISPPLDASLRWILVTPDMHRVHHSLIVQETNSNFGFNLPWWDRLFGTYRPQPTNGHDQMRIGIEEFRDPVDSRIDRLVLQPFIGEAGDYPLSRREKPQK